MEIGDLRCWQLVVCAQHGVQQIGDDFYQVLNGEINNVHYHDDEEEEGEKGMWRKGKKTRKEGDLFI